MSDDGLDRLAARMSQGAPLLKPVEQMAETPADGPTTYPVPKGLRAGRESEIREGVLAGIKGLLGDAPISAKARPSSAEPTSNNNAPNYKDGRQVEVGDVFHDHSGLLSRVDIIEAEGSVWVNTPTMGPILVTGQYTEHCKLVRRKKVNAK